MKISQYTANVKFSILAAILEYASEGAVKAVDLLLKQKRLITEDCEWVKIMEHNARLVGCLTEDYFDQCV